MQSLPAVAGIGVASLDQCIPLVFESVQVKENNILIEAYNAERKGTYVHWHH